MTLTPANDPSAQPRTLYSFLRSGTSHRVRIALNLKGLSYDQVAIDLRRDAHTAPAYQAVNPQMLVPALDIGGTVLTQSPAILEWLDEQYPTPALLPADPLGRAQVRASAAIVGCDIHPVNNRRVLEALRHDHGASDKAVDSWCQRWISAGFDAFDTLVQAHGRGPFSFGQQPTLADVYLVPQIDSARRFKVDLRRWPRLLEIDAACALLDAFRLAAPGAQPDAS